MKSIRNLKHNVYQRITAEGVLNKIGLLYRENLNSFIKSFLTDKNTVFGQGNFSLTSTWGFKLDKENFWIQRKNAQNVYGIIQDQDISLSVDSSDVQDRYDLVQGRYSVIDSDLESVEIIDPVAGTLGSQNFYTSKKTNLQVNVVKGIPGSGVAPQLTSSDVAKTIGTQDLSLGVDLSVNYNIKFAIDNSSYFTVDCRGSIPSATSISEIVSAINTAFGQTIAYDNGGFLEIRSILNGDDGKIEFKPPLEKDALNLLMGLTLTINYYYAYFGDIGYFKIGEIRVSGGSTQLIVDDLRGVSRTSEWVTDPNTNSISNTVQQHREMIPIDHPDNSITRTKIIDEAIGTLQLESTDNADKIQRINVANEAIGTNQIEKTNDADKIKNDNIGDFQVGISKYHHLLHNNGRWFEPECINKNQLESAMPGGIGARCIFIDTNLYGGFNPNGMYVVLGTNGTIYRYSLKTGILIDSYAFSIPDGYTGIQVNHNGVSYYLFCIYSGSSPYNIVRIVEISGSGILSATVTYSTSNLSRLNVFGMCFYNNFVYTSNYGSTTNNGIYVDKIPIADLIIGGSTWVNVKTIATPARLRGICVDINTGVFYVIESNATNSRFITFADDGSNSYQVSPNFGLEIGQFCQVYNDSIYSTQGTLNSGLIRSFKTLITFNDTWLNVVRTEYRWFNDLLSGSAGYLMDFKIYSDGRALFSNRTIGQYNGYGFIQHKLKINKKESDSENSYIGFVIGEKAHILNNEWEIDILKTGIDMVNRIGGRVDGLSTYLSAGQCFYQVWAFADANNEFKGFGLTRLPNVWLPNIDWTLASLKGEQFTILASNAKFSYYSTIGDKDENNLYPFSHFTIGATIRLMTTDNSTTFSSGHIRLAKIISISATEMVCETYYSTSNTATANIVHVVQLDNFKPFVNGSAQNLAYPKYKLVSQPFCFRNSGMIRKFWFQDWKNFRFSEDETNDLHTNNFSGSLSRDIRIDNFLPPLSKCKVSVYSASAAANLITSNIFSRDKKQFLNKLEARGAEGNSGGTTRSSYTFDSFFPSSTLFFLIVHAFAADLSISPIGFEEDYN